MTRFEWQTQPLFDGAFVALRITARPDTTRCRMSNGWYIGDTFGKTNVEVHTLWVGQMPELTPIVATPGHIAEIVAALSEFNEKGGA